MCVSPTIKYCTYLLVSLFLVCFADVFVFGSQEDNDFQLHKYSSYEEYKRIQTEGNKRKLDRQFVDEKSIQHIAAWILHNQGNVTYGICHGTRQGNEQRWFAEHLAGDVHVLGTEISDTATQFPKTIQWDYHLMKEEWLGHFDFVYSNTLDHSYEPQLAVDRWMASLNGKGKLFLEWTKVGHTVHVATELDPFGADLGGYAKLLKKYHLCDILHIREKFERYVLVASKSC